MCAISAPLPGHQARRRTLPLRCTLIRGTKQIVSVNYLFGRPLIPFDFPERIVTSNFRDMRNLMSVVYGLSKVSFWV